MRINEGRFGQLRVDVVHGCGSVEVHSQEDEVTWWGMSMSNDA